VHAQEYRNSDAQYRHKYLVGIVASPRCAGRTVSIRRQIIMVRRLEPSNGPYFVLSTELAYSENTRVTAWGLSIHGK
jgi:hypothetical protein